MPTVNDSLFTARKLLQQNNIQSAALDARILMQHALGKSLEELLLCGDVELSLKEQEQFDVLIQRRAKQEPVAKIVGWKEFYGRRFKTTRDTLDPRPDTETLIEAILLHRDNIPSDAKILDIGTGTGCLALTLLAECSQWRGVAVDVSAKALAVASENMMELGLDSRCECLLSDCFDSVSGKFDLIVSNPPYIADAEKADLDNDVLDFEPHTALFASDDGLYFYRKITTQAPAKLADGGWLFFEVGYTQADKVAEMMKKNGFSNIFKKVDISGVYRVVGGYLSK